VSNYFRHQDAARLLPICTEPRPEGWGADFSPRRHRRSIPQTGQKSCRSGNAEEDEDEVRNIIEVGVG
jgi:hypothetical protein